MKPIHKFNGGQGATLCNECRKIITTGLTEDLFCEDHISSVESPGAPNAKKYTLTRHDGLVKTGERIGWITWNEDGSGRELKDKPEIGSSLVLDLTGLSWQWMTTAVTEIISQTDTEIKFDTKNSNYTLTVKQ